MLQTRSLDFRARGSSFCTGDNTIYYRRDFKETGAEARLRNLHADSRESKLVAMKWLAYQVRECQGGQCPRCGVAFGLSSLRDLFCFPCVSRFTHTVPDHDGYGITDDRS